MNDAIRVVSVCLALTAGLVAGCGDKGRSAGDAFAQSAPPASASPQVPAVATESKPVVDAPGFYAGETGLTPSERAGREIWYKATAGNARFHTYVFQQRVNVLIDWYRVLNARDRDDRFKAWGLINDPGCCMPGAEGCPAKSLDETYGFQWCPGDDQLLPYVGKEGYRDPACDFRDAPMDPADPHAKSADQRQSACDLAFGTSTGALGYRKFPNPRFDPKRWLALNGSLASWEGYRGAMSKNGAPSDAERNRLADGSIEPPLPDRHDLRLVPHRVRSAEPAGGSGAACLGEPQGRGRQPVHARLGDPDVRHARQHARSADVLVHASRARPTRRRSRATRSTTPAR